MKIVVTEAFYDKNTGEPYNRGEIYESADESRIEELRAAGVLAPAALEESIEPNGVDEAPSQTAGETTAELTGETKVDADVQPEATPAAAADKEKPKAKQDK